MVENNDLRKQISEVTEKVENNDMNNDTKKEIFEMRKEIQEILSKINSSTNWIVYIPPCLY